MSRPIKMLSPSRLGALDCPARVAFQQMSPRRHEANPMSLAGTIVHEALERVVQGEDVYTAWDMSVEARIEGDPRDTIPGIRRIRRRYVRFADQVATFLSSEDSVPVPEAELISSDGAIGGTCDLLIERSTSLVVIDYKSGSVTNDGGDVDPHYADQIRIYAALAAETYEKPISSAVLWSMKQGPIEVPVDAAAIESVMLKARTARDAFNARVPGAQPAKPDPTTCRWCSFKVQCDAYWAELSPGWADLMGSHSVSGKVVTVQESKVGLVAVRMSGVVGTDGECDVVAGIDGPWRPDVGDSIRVAGLTAAKDESTALRWNRFSSGWTVAT